MIMTWMLCLILGEKVLTTRNKGGYEIDLHGGKSGQV